MREALWGRLRAHTPVGWTQPCHFTTWTWGNHCMLCASVSAPVKWGFYQDPAPRVGTGSMEGRAERSAWVAGFRMHFEAGAGEPG